MNPIEVVKFYKGRDMSPYLFHFVKGDKPLSVLEQILNDNALKTEKHDFISFTESPLRVMADILDYFQKFKNKPNCRPMYEKYGIGINKKYMYEECGARPVIYGPIEDKQLIDKTLRWRFELLDFVKRDFSWQREWRTKGNYFELPEDDEDVVVICEYEEEISSLRSMTNHPCVSLEWVVNNHATDFDVEGASVCRLLTDWEKITLREEGVKLKKQRDEKGI